MRIEKGHLAGNEIEGRTTTHDLGLGRLVSKKKKDFIGKVLADRSALLDPDRPCLAGFRPRDSSKRLYAGAHLLPAGVAHTAANDQGVITSVAFRHRSMAGSVSDS